MKYKLLRNNLPDIEEVKRQASIHKTNKEVAKALNLSFSQFYYLYFRAESIKNSKIQVYSTEFADAVNRGRTIFKRNKLINNT